MTDAPLVKQHQGRAVFFTKLHGIVSCKGQVPVADTQIAVEQLLI